MSAPLAGPQPQTTARRTRRTRANETGAAPRQCWYAAATSHEVGGSLRAVTVLGSALVLFRLGDGTVAALEDRCAHRPYPLSAGRLIDDTVRCGLCGFAYDASGACVSVPTQERVPVGAAVRPFPVREADGTVWVWPGAVGRAGQQRIPDLPWLETATWATVGDSLIVPAPYLLLHESFADVTKIPVLAPKIAPAALDSTPALDVVVTQTTVSLARTYQPAPLPDWQRRALGEEPDSAFAHAQQGHFLSPAAWVDHWDVHRPTAATGSVDGRSPDVHRLRFTHLVTPLDERTTRLAWFVSRDFAVHNDATSAELTQMFDDYYRRLAEALGRMQTVLERDGPRREVSVSADEAALRVRGIVHAMLDEEGGTGASR